MSKKLLRIAALTAALALAFAGSAMAEKVWEGGAGGNEQDWDQANNWKDPGVPGVGDDVKIPKVTPHFPKVNAAGNAKSVTLTEDEAKLEIDAAALTIAAGGYLKAAGDVSVIGANKLTWAANGEIQVVKGKTLTLSSGVDITGTLTVSGGGTLKISGTLENTATKLVVKDESKVEFAGVAAGLVDVVLEKNAVLDLKANASALAKVDMAEGAVLGVEANQAALANIDMGKGAVANFKGAAGTTLALTVSCDVANAATVNIDALANTPSLTVNGPTVNLKAVSTIPAWQIEKGKVVTGVQYAFGTSDASTTEVAVSKDAVLDLGNKPVAFKSLKEAAVGVRGSVMNAGSVGINVAPGSEISLPLDVEVSVFGTTNALTVKSDVKSLVVNAGAVGSVPTVTLDDKAEKIQTLEFKADATQTRLGSLKVNNNSAIGTLKFDIVALGLPVNVDGGKKLTVGVLEKAGGAPLLETDTILTKQGNGELVLKDGKEGSKGQITVSAGKLRVEKAAALLEASKLNVANVATLSLANGLMMPAMELASVGGDGAKLLVDLVEANVQGTPAMKLKTLAGSAGKWDLSGLQIPTTMAVGDKLCVAMTTGGVALDKNHFGPVVTDMEAEVDNLNILNLKATKVISVPKLTPPASLKVTPKVLYEGEIAVSGVESANADWNNASATLVAGDATTVLGAFDITPLSSDMKLKLSFFPKEKFVSADVKVTLPVIGAGFPGSVVLNLSTQDVVVPEPDKLTASLTASKPTVKVGETVEFELGKWQYKGAEVEVQDVKWELDGVDKTADVVAGKLPAKAEKEGTMNLVVTAKLKADPTVVGEAKASVTVTKDGGSTGGTGGSGGGGCDAGFAGLALLLAAPLFLRKKD